MLYSVIKQIYKLVICIVIKEFKIESMAHTVKTH